MANNYNRVCLFMSSRLLARFCCHAVIKRLTYMHVSVLTLLASVWWYCGTGICEGVYV